MIIVRASKYGCGSYLRLNDGSEHEIPGFLAVRLPDNKNNYFAEIRLDPKYVTYVKDDNNDKP